MIDPTPYEHIIKVYIKRLRCFCKGALCEDDLMQAGRLAIVHAWERFEPERGFKFETYANYWVRHKLWLQVMAMGYPVRYPNEAFKTLRKKAANGNVPFGASLDAERGDGVTMKELIPDKHRVSLDESTMLAHLSELESGLMRDLLDDRERDIVARHFTDDETLASAGKRHGISRERARQLFERGMQRLRTSARAEELREFLEAS